MMTPDPTADASEPTLEHYVCATCGATVAYEAGTRDLRCTSCGARQTVAGESGPAVENSYAAWLQHPAGRAAQTGPETLNCRTCGAPTQTTKLAALCPYCRGPLVTDGSPGGMRAPDGIVPFGVGKDAATDAVRTWVRSRRFAPAALKRAASSGAAVTGTYLPHWTYDAHADARYEGSRGDHYWVTETYQVSDGKGGFTTETRQVQHTRWSHAEGVVAHDFDDVLISAVSTANEPHRLQQAGPWALSTTVPFTPDYLAGYEAGRYEVEPEDGWTSAQSVMSQVLEQDAKDDIGGDEQRVESLQAGYRDVMFKLILLPLWLATYNFRGQSFQVTVNANTGEVVGDRPYSPLKIASAVLLAAIVIGGIVTALYVSKSH
jgi:DNA-directed RNA polymerase subunit RPC12/RpoP